VKITILGAGLIGGSIGLAAKARMDAEVTGWDPDQSACTVGKRIGALDLAADTIQGAVEHADMVFLAAPVGALATLARVALQAAGPDCAVSDVGSTKRALAELSSDGRFLGGHPLAGAEASGIEHARGDLFVGSSWYLTPTPDTRADLRRRLEDAVTRFGAKPVEIDPETHDRLMARVSHLPHVLANVLAREAARALDEHTEVAAAIGPSLRDATRVAGANTRVWSDIYLANRDFLVEAIDAASNELAMVRSALADADERAIANWNEQARSDRARLIGESAHVAPGPAQPAR
jgi:prephenate dehydrogenase